MSQIKDDGWMMSRVRVLKSCYLPCGSVFAPLKGSTKRQEVIILQIIYNNRQYTQQQET